jgi:hypothetical protein
MPSTILPLPTLESLRVYVRQTLCERDRLDPEETPFFAAEVRRRGRLCGYLFHIEGPRLLKNSALWTEDDHRIVFYDSAGNRFQEAILSDAPVMHEQPLRRAA